MSVKSGFAGVLALAVIGAAVWLLRRRPPAPVAPVAVKQTPPTPPIAAAPPPAPAPAAHATTAAPPVAEDAQAGRVENDLESEDESDGDFASFERSAESAVIEPATKRRVPIPEGAGWEALAIVAADGGLAAIVYRFANDDVEGACGDPRFLIVGKDGGTTRLAFDGNAGPGGVSAGLFAIRREGDLRVATVAGEPVLTERHFGNCVAGAPDGGAQTRWVLVDPSGNLQPMKTVHLP